MDNLAEVGVLLNGEFVPIRQKAEKTVDTMGVTTEAHMRNYGIHVTAEEKAAIGSGGGHIILDANGAAMPQRKALQIMDGNMVDTPDATQLSGMKGGKGDKGDKGDTGGKGDKGDPGAVGGKGDPGDPGADGKSAFTSAVEGGFAGTVEDFNAALSSVADKSETFFARNVAVPVSAWMADTTYAGFGFRATVGLNGVTAEMFPNVVFSPADSALGVYAPVADSTNGGMYIYANKIPTEAVTLLTISATSGRMVA